MGNIHISGSGCMNSEGGCYDEVRISGSGHIKGSLRCRSVSVSGSGRFEGNVFCDEDVRTSGSARFEKSIECGGLYDSGSVHIENDLKCGVFRVSGSSRINGSVSCTEAEISGAVYIGNDMSGENIEINGGSNITGLLNAESIRIFLGGKNTVGEIGCTRLSVEPHKSFRALHFGLFSRESKSSKRLVCPIIEGDEVSLSCTTSKVVRGKNVRIGPGCEIERVEYSESIYVDESAAVGERIKI